LVDLLAQPSCAEPQGGAGSAHQGGILVGAPAMFPTTLWCYYLGEMLLGRPIVDLLPYHEDYERRQGGAKDKQPRGDRYP
jgi:hypothetical protein